jgi:hypothetical protein
MKCAILSDMAQSRSGVVVSTQCTPGTNIQDIHSFNTIVYKS